MWKTEVDRHSEGKDSKVLYILRKLNGIGSGDTKRIGTELPQLYLVIRER